MIDQERSHTQIIIWFLSFLSENIGLACVLVLYDGEKQTYCVSVSIAWLFILSELSLALNKEDCD